MSLFTDDLELKFVNGKIWELTKEFSYYLTDDKNIVITVPKGYRTDFASIPTIFWSFLTHKDIFNKASIIHDYLCDTNGDDRFNKEQVDKIYLEAQGIVKIPFLKAYIFYYFASKFGTINRIDYTKKGE